MLKKFPGLMVVWCVLLLTGCLDYGRQTLTYRYDGKRDTLRILLANIHHLQGPGLGHGFQAQGLVEFSDVEVALFQDDLAN